MNTQKMRLIALVTALLMLLGLVPALAEAEIPAPVHIQLAPGQALQTQMSIEVNPEAGNLMAQMLGSFGGPSLDQLRAIVSTLNQLKISVLQDNSTVNLVLGTDKGDLASILMQVDPENLSNAYTVDLLPGIAFSLDPEYMQAIQAQQAEMMAMSAQLPALLAPYQAALGQEYSKLANRLTFAPGHYDLGEFGVFQSKAAVYLDSYALAEMLQSLALVVEQDQNLKELVEGMSSQLEPMMEQSGLGFLDEPGMTEETAQEAAPLVVGEGSNTTVIEGKDSTIIIIIGGKTQKTAEASEETVEEVTEEAQEAVEEAGEEVEEALSLPEDGTEPPKDDLAAKLKEAVHSLRAEAPRLLYTGYYYRGEQRDYLDLASPDFSESPEKIDLLLYTTEEGQAFDLQMMAAMTQTQVEDRQAMDWPALKADLLEGRNNTGFYLALRSELSEDQSSTKTRVNVITLGMPFGLDISASADKEALNGQFSLGLAALGIERLLSIQVNTNKVTDAPILPLVDESTLMIPIGMDQDGQPDVEALDKLPEEVQQQLYVIIQGALPKLLERLFVALPEEAPILLAMFQPQHLQPQLSPDESPQVVEGEATEDVEEAPPADETPAEETPAEETPAEETPAEETTNP